MTDKNKQSQQLTLTEAARLASGKDMAPPTIPIKFDGEQSAKCNCELLPNEHEVCEHPMQSKLPPWYAPLTVGNWTTEEWKAAIDSVFAKRRTYQPDSLSAIFRDIATDAYCQLLQVQRERDEAHRMWKIDNALSRSRIVELEAALAAANQRIALLEKDAGVGE